AFPTQVQCFVFLVAHDQEQLLVTLNVLFPPFSCRVLRLPQRAPPCGWQSRVVFSHIYCPPRIGNATMASIYSGGLRHSEFMFYRCSRSLHRGFVLRCRPSARMQSVVVPYAEAAAGNRRERNAQLATEKASFMVVRKSARTAVGTQADCLRS